ncbi:MAG: trypsin-like peptidase domain-containing protein [Myxococcota bacterium]|nr:trypsin-like peptidase domain-containing protein [Myxococcota bacterium]
MLARGCALIRSLLLSAALAACASPRVNITVLCPRSEEVFIDGDLRGVGKATASLASGETKARCGKRKALKINVRNGEKDPTFDFRGLSGVGENATGSLTRQSIFQKSAPATVFIVIQHRGGTSIGSGVIIEPGGKVITNKHVVRAALSGGRMRVYLYGSTEPSPRAGDLRAFLQVNRGKGLKAVVVKRHKTLDLALLKLPKRDRAYPYLKLGGEARLEIGAEVLALGNPDGLAWSLTSGSVSGIRKGLIQHQAPINPGNSGGPLIDIQGRLVGINTFVRNRTERRGDSNVAYAGLGFALPSSLVGSFLRDDGGAAKVLTAKSLSPKTTDDDSDLLTQLLVTAVTVWSKTGSQPLALRAACDVLAATVSQGRSGFLYRVNAAWINEGLNAAVAQFPPLKRARLPALMATHWPKVLFDATGTLWTLNGSNYVETTQAIAWAVDDTKGTIYFAQSNGSLWRLDEAKEAVPVPGSSKVKGVQASQGTVYWLSQDGRVYASDGKTSHKLGRAPVSGFLLASRGHLYMLDSERDLFAYHDGSWANGGKPIANHVLSVTAHGEHWYGLDGKRHVYSGDLSRYIDKDGDAVALRAVGPDLLVFNADGRLYRFDLAKEKWHSMGR